MSDMGLNLGLGIRPGAADNEPQGRHAAPEELVASQDSQSSSTIIERVTQHFSLVAMEALESSVSEEGAPVSIEMLFKGFVAMLTGLDEGEQPFALGYDYYRTLFMTYLNAVLAKRDDFFFNGFTLQMIDASDLDEDTIGQIKYSQQVLMNSLSSAMYFPIEVVSQD